MDFEYSTWEKTLLKYRGKDENTLNILSYVNLNALSIMNAHNMLNSQLPKFKNLYSRKF